MAGVPNTSARSFGMEVGRKMKRRICPKSGHTSAGRVQGRRLLNRVGPTDGAAHASADALSGALVQSVLIDRNVLAVAFTHAGCVAHDAAHVVVGAVEEVHVGVLILVGVGAPAEKNVSGVGVQVDEPANLGVRVQNPLEVLGLGLREGAGAFFFAKEKNNDVLETAVKV